MGLDIYAGTLTRYYSRNWKTAVQQWGEANGIQVNIVRPEEQQGETVPADMILQDVTGWRDALIEALGENITRRPLWNEDNDVTPYYTDKPDWDALGALQLYVCCKSIGAELPAAVAKGFNVNETPEYERFMEQKQNPISLFESDGWWLPIADSFMFNGYLLTGHPRTIATVGMLKDELEEINALEWNADEQTIIGWRDTEGYPTDALYGGGKVDYIAKHTEYGTESLAKFAFSILWQAVRHSEQYGTLIIYDF